MSTHSIHSLRDTFAVTVAFAVATPILMLVMFLVADVPGANSGQSFGVTDWYKVGATVVAFAGFAGLLVDTMRLLASRYWPT